MAADLNVAYPIERLPEMQREGAIGALASRHMSFMGAIVWSRSQRSSSTPAAAQHGFCARTVSTLSC
jgi:hypothetical protein